MVKNHKDLMEYKVTYITESPYLKSIEILEKKEPSIIKIIMKAREFTFKNIKDVENIEALKWFEYLNKYVQNSNGKRYIRVIAIDPQSQQEAEVEYNWINQMIERLKKNDVTNCEINIIIRDITLSCVLLDSEASFFAFLIDKKFKNFTMISSKEQCILTEGINDWFDKKFSTRKENIYTIFKDGQFNNDSFKKLQDEISQSFC